VKLGGEAQGCPFCPGTTGKGKTGRVNASEPLFNASTRLSPARRKFQQGAGTGRWKAAGAGRIQIADWEDTTVPGAEEAPTPVVSELVRNTETPTGSDHCPCRVVGRLTVRKAAFPSGTG